MTLPASLRDPRRWILAWLLALALLWCVQIERAHEQRLWFASTPPMCKSVPRYEEVAGALPSTPAAVEFFTDVPDPDGAERLFCAQYALAPHALERWRPGLGLPRFDLEKLVLVAHVSDPRRLDEIAAPVLAEAGRRGLRVQRRTWPDGVTVVTVGRR
jgi:hypothetical protein